MNKFLVAIVLGVVMTSCVGGDEDVKKDMKALKEDVETLKIELKKMKEDNAKLVKDAVSAEESKEDALEGSANN